MVLADGPNIKFASSTKVCPKSIVCLAVKITYLLLIDYDLLIDIFAFALTPHPDPYIETSADNYLDNYEADVAVRIFIDPPYPETY